MSRFKFFCSELQKVPNLCGKCVGCLEFRRHKTNSCWDQTTLGRNKYNPSASLFNRRGLLGREKEFPLAKLSVPEVGCTLLMFCFPAGHLLSWDTYLLPAYVLLKRKKRQFRGEVIELPGIGRSETYPSCPQPNISCF